MAFAQDAWKNKKIPDDAPYADGQTGSQKPLYPSGSVKPIPGQPLADTVKGNY